MTSTLFFRSLLKRMKSDPDGGLTVLLPRNLGLLISDHHLPEHLIQSIA